MKSDMAVNTADTVDCMCVGVWSWDLSERRMSSLAGDLNTFGEGWKRLQL